MEIMRVQTLAAADLVDLPPQFIRPENERPENSVAVEGVNVPVISLSKSETEIVDEISRASSDWGFFVLTDHGIPPLLIQRLKEVGDEFFRLSAEEKERYANDPLNGKFEGYGTKMTKNEDEKFEWIDYLFHLMAPPSMVNYDCWPKFPTSYKKVTEDYTEEILNVTNKLLQILSKGLGLEKEVLKSSLGGEKIELEMKINMYPPCPQPHLALGVEAHTDMSALTVLVSNEISGLQIRKDDKWVLVNYIPNALFVHIGDQLEVLSNGKYKSVLHRSVVSKENMRMSWAVFCSPPQDTLIGPLSRLLDEQNLPKYSKKSYSEYRYRKFNKLPQ